MLFRRIIVIVVVVVDVVLKVLSFFFVLEVAPYNIYQIMLVGFLE